MNDRRRYTLAACVLVAAALLLAGACAMMGRSFSTAEVYAWPLTPMPSPTPPATRPRGPAFVRAGGSGGWCLQDDPCGSIQYAIEQSEPGNGDTIYVAQGTYTGTGGAVITITRPITLYGGWDGAAGGPVHCDPEMYPAVLDGEGERRVVYIGNNIVARLEGLVIARGNAGHAPVSAGYGGGIYSFQATPILINNLITGNVAYTGTRIGGGGGGIDIALPPGTVVISGNRMIFNVASTITRGTGGGMNLLLAPGAQVVNNLILSNTAALSAPYGYGGGITIDSGSDGSLLQGNQVRGNIALGQGGGNGQAYGGGIYLTSDEVVVTGNLVLSNTALLTNGVGYGGGIGFSTGKAVTITHNRIEYNVAQAHPGTIIGSYGGGIYGFLSSDALIADNVIRYNKAGYGRGGGGGITLWWYCNYATIARNLIEGNQAGIGTARGYGGGIYLYDSRAIQIEANRIVSNTASPLFTGYGGGLYIQRNSSFTMTNNIVARNHADEAGGGMGCEAWSTGPVTGTLVHNTFVANERGSGEGRVAIHLSTPGVMLVLTNNLILSHTFGLYAVAGSTATLYHTLFYAHSEGDTGGDGLIVNTDPITGEDPLLDTEDHLRPGSPAVDAGLPISWVTDDIDGDPRPVGLAPDIGADEIDLRLYLPLVLKNR